MPTVAAANGGVRATAREASPGVRLSTAGVFLSAAVLGLLGVREQLVSWAWMWLTGLLLFGGFKLLTVLRLDARDRARLSAGRLLGYFVLWPGLRPEPFLKPPQREPGDLAGAQATAWPTLWASGCVNLLLGATVLWIVPQALPTGSPMWLLGWAGMIGLCLILHFGVFDLLAAGWLYAGVPVEKVFRNPLRSTSLAEFWGSRWNRAFSDFARELIFRPLARPIGSGLASLAVFAFSGLMHELVTSVPAGAGYGGPTLYFLIQFALAQVEDRGRLRRFLSRRPVLGWLWTTLAVLGPVPLLMHGPFLADVVMPFLQALGSQVDA